MYPPPQQFTPVYVTPIHHQHHHTPVNLVNPVNSQQHPVSPPPFISPLMTPQSQTKFPQLDSGFAVPMFQQGEDPIECIHKAMAFLSAVASRFPPLNNQIKTSSNHINQATIQDGRLTVQQVQGRQHQSYAGEGHMARQCTRPKRPRNAAWFMGKLMLAEAQKAGQILDEKQLAFLAYPILMANLLSYDPEVLSEDTNPSAPNDLLVLYLVEQMTDHVAHLDKENQTNKMVNESLTAELERYKERVALFEQRINVDLNKREKLIDSQLDDLIRNRNAKLAAF
ncbi:hypothetical protein Tco_1469276, partial [Tanacetum coccineum]